MLLVNQNTPCSAVLLRRWMVTSPAPPINMVVVPSPMLALQFERINHLDWEIFEEYLRPDSFSYFWHGAVLGVGCGGVKKESVWGVYVSGLYHYVWTGPRQWWQCVVGAN